MARGQLKQSLHRDENDFFPNRVDGVSWVGAACGEVGDGVFPEPLCAAGLSTSGTVLFLILSTLQRMDASSGCFMEHTYTSATRKYNRLAFGTRNS